MRPGRKLLAGATVAAGTLLLAAACGSSSKPATGSSGRTFTIGVLADESGLGASLDGTLVSGVKAGALLAGQEGVHIRYVVADTTSSPAGTLAAAHLLLDKDHVFAVIGGTPFGSSSSPFLASHGIPVVGGANTPEWATDRNMFSVYGPVDGTKTASTYGAFMKQEGATNVAVIFYGGAPNGAAMVGAIAGSAKAAGLKAGYVNDSLAFGSTNVQPIALAMKSAGIDGMIPLTDANTSFALVTAARAAGVRLKVAFLPTGYGGDIAQAGPGALQAGQGLYFLSAFEPVEMNTPATRQLQGYLKSAGVTTDPTTAEYDGYASMALLAQGIKAAGGNPTQTQLIKALSDINDFSAAGLLGSHTLNLAQRSGIVTGPDNCVYVTQLIGSGFKLVSGADPICGTVLGGASG
jgi:branched-chain amino acid transport system substrate-binding protein